ncbi:putative sulfate exporter family transporter [Mycobacterium sp. KBS0706]|uniref:YeiH family protein n=1 Tax=Mycobacterium sp. KBS0706 TaxID=2578109 RepID=UPI00110F7AB8|nr:putative sulfate exporter family transporter [Mycobacterium sp. KBS0706]TSD88804.1 putative sulfate exporter family transporter [Mycobacterium sp. KBS0706]
MAIVDPFRPSLPATQRLTAIGSIPGARLVPGLLLCGAVTLAALGLERVETGLFGHAWLEALVLAILVGALVRTLWTPSRRWMPGISFSAKTLLEIAVVLLGASVSIGAIVSAGPLLLVGIAAVVVIAIAASYGMGRMLGLPHRMAVLVACGNSICGNSAIAAVAPVIGADGKEVAASIAFTAVLGVVVVLGLPFLPALMHISEVQYGVLAGLTVYAVPQVLAATAPIGAIALQLGTLVKLVRVLMLGPMILVLTLVTRRRTDGGGAATAGRMPWHKLVPWFIDGFLLLAVLRSFGMLPEVVLAPAATAATALTVISMAALGLSTDLGSVAKAGGRVTAAVTLSLLVLGAISFGLIRLLGIV